MKAESGWKERGKRREETREREKRKRMKDRGRVGGGGESIKEQG